MKKVKSGELPKIDKNDGWILWDQALSSMLCHSLDSCYRLSIIMKPDPWPEFRETNGV